jgi:hypothetical protein
MEDIPQGYEGLVTPTDFMAVDITKLTKWPRSKVSLYEYPADICLNPHATDTYYYIHLTQRPT